MNTSPPSQTDRRNSSGGSSFTSTNSAGTASHNNNHNHNHHHTMSTDCQDPLAALERDLLAHPHRRYSHSHYPHPPVARQQEAHLMPPSSSNNDSRGSRSPSTSPSPSPAARRCMAATAAWTPSLDRRQSWDGQAYRRAMMLQSTGLVCGCHPTNAAETVNGGTRTHHHHRHNSSGGSGPSTRSIYEADRGFSEVVGSTRM